MRFLFGTRAAKAADSPFKYGVGGSIFGGGWSPSDVTDVAAWYYLEPDGLSDGQIIDTVTDLSGAGAEDFTQPSASLQPTYDAATGGWETTSSGGNLLGASLTDWKFLHGGEASVTFRAAIDTADNAYLFNTLFGPNVGSGIWVYWAGGASRWTIRIGGIQRVSTPSVAPTDAQMHVFTFTWAADGSGEIYMDGVQVSTFSAGSFSYNTDDQASVGVLCSSYFTGLDSSDMIMTDAIFGTEHIDATQALAIYDGLDGLRS
jgi:hypothetical protein